ncbi:MAG: thiamine-phosphate kinase [Phycisphaerales bacterium]|nr:thiamine-phosphate kinase [Phycisphaerales bacterium]
MNEQRILSQIQSLGVDPVTVPIGPGDDMAMLNLAAHGASDSMLVAVDQVIDGIHVDCSRTSMRSIGHKAVARCLSDVAAMAARPMACLVSAVLPVGCSDESAIELFDGMRETALRHRAPIVGGDLSSHRVDHAPLTCSVTVLATPTDNGPVERFGAEIGDIVAVTGALGGSLGADGGGRHLTFEPRIGEAIMIHAVLGADLHAMIDISDGLGTDAAHLLERSPQMQIRIESKDLPVQPGLDWRRAMTDGEDYELCFCARGEIPAQVLDCSVTQIGRVVERAEGDTRVVVVVDESGVEHDLTNAGWEHAS